MPAGSRTTALTPEPRAGVRRRAAPSGSLKEVPLDLRLCHQQRRGFDDHLGPRFRSRRRFLLLGILAVSRSSGAARPSTTQFLPPGVALTAARFVEQFKTTYGGFCNKLRASVPKSSRVTGTSFTPPRPGILLLSLTVTESPDLCDSEFLSQYTSFQTAIAGSEQRRPASAARDASPARCTQVDRDRSRLRQQRELPQFVGGST